jgi:hypothetical protein
LQPIDAPIMKEGREVFAAGATLLR